MKISKKNLMAFVKNHAYCINKRGVYYAEET